MALLGRRRKSVRVTCHFCSTPSLLLPPQPPTSSEPRRPREQLEGSGATAVGTERDFYCSVCGCFNRKDKNGDFISFLPEMADPSSNNEAFSKRAATRAPFASTSSPSPNTPQFCRTCETNQALQLNLLANFLPSDEEMDQAAQDELLERLPAYRASLDARYPLVCPTCEPFVTSIIDARDYRARVTALGKIFGSKRGSQGSPRNGVGKGKEREVWGEGVGGWRWKAAGMVWLVRGLLWWGTQLGSIGGCILYAVDPVRWETTRPRKQLLISFAVSSFLWSFWNPTWKKARRRRAQGRPVKVTGQAQHLVANVLSYSTRIALCVLAPTDGHSLSRELVLGVAVGLTSLFLVALFSLRVHSPAGVQLSSGTLTRRRGPVPQPLSDEALFAGLSVSSSPSYASARAPSAFTPTSDTRRLTRRQSPLGRPTSPDVFSVSSVSSVAEGEAMDWAPTPPRASRAVDLPPQRFMPPASMSGTGLESLFGDVRMETDESAAAAATSTEAFQGAGWGRTLWRAVSSLGE